MCLGNNRITDANTELNKLLGNDDLNSKLRKIRHQYCCREWIGNLPIIFIGCGVTACLVASPNTLKYMILTVFLLLAVTTWLMVPIYSKLILLFLRVFPIKVIFLMKFLKHACYIQLAFLIISTAVFLMLISAVKKYDSSDLIKTNKDLKEKLAKIYTGDSHLKDLDWGTIAQVANNRVQDKKDMNDELIHVLSFTSLVTIIIKSFSKNAKGVFNFLLFIILAIVNIGHCNSIYFNGNV